MYKLIIADDENGIREGIKNILSWEEYDIRIVGEADDGFKALALIEELKPHIVLTDVKMPNMDGISLLKEIKHRGYTSRAIVLSGYDDFTLVRQAMKYGAVDYLLKPVGKQELIQAIEELLDELEKTNGLETGVDIARNNFLSRIIMTPISAMEFREKTEMLGIDFGKGRLAVARLPKQNISGDAISTEDMHKIEEICIRLLEENHTGMVFSNTNDEITVILYNIINERKDDICKKQLLEVLDRIYRQLSIKLYFAVSKAYKSYRNLKTAYEEADDTLKYIFIFEDADILYAEEIDDYFRNNEVQTVISQERTEEILKNGDVDDIEEYLESVFGNSQDILKGADIYVFRNMAMEMLIYYYHFLMINLSSDRLKLNDEKTAVMKKITEINTLESMKVYLKEVFSDVRSQYIKYTTRSHNKLVEDVLREINERYMNPDLSLQYLSDELNANTAYLGRLFKKEMGISFIDYLNWYRIEKAEMLLKETNLKGSELCTQVGYSNYNYFYVVFKKLKGKKPTEVRG